MLRTVGRPVVLAGIFFVAICGIAWAGGFEEPPAGSSPPDSATYAGMFHVFDSFDISNISEAFSRSIVLWVTESVESEWDSTEVANFILDVFDDDSTNTDDVFPYIWSYFCFSDNDSTYAGIDYTLEGGSTHHNVVHLRLYNIDDFDCEGADAGSFYCKGYAFRLAGSTSITMPMKGRTSEEWNSPAFVTPGYAHWSSPRFVDTSKAKLVARGGVHGTAKVFPRV